MDIIDDAKAREEQDRARAIEHHNSQRKQEPAQQKAGRYVVCIDCCEPISAQRLAAKPNAARCIDCQGFLEQGGAHV
ncbi:RNA polymerase-binding transcription factor DksA [BD1-7 clade bacterium]|uniref:RNA polymerase-binding transcription factor DksA n=1 Tax=BD1-7 clade bacterium TaxID=2029982 RepID=A0A5S9Q237_9GAMM|nr:RNA polymerase-binding transcription factor DksA [BD1-7 clade bacterium]CAA0111742.1 RNA polymerase-binding transcription factor DksA [BD1-7 clade bacterium]